MKIKIEIECDTVKEVFQHLYVIRKDVKRALVRHAVTPVKRLTISDDNCYGSHEVIINNTGKNETI